MGPLMDTICPETGSQAAGIGISEDVTYIHPEIVVQISALLVLKQ